MKKSLALTAVLFVLLGLFYYSKVETPVRVEQMKKEYWFVLNRKSNKEFLFFGEPGNKESSALVKVFAVKSGIPNQRPTPLPQLLGRDYWRIIKKEESLNNPETSPYFLTLDIPVPEGPPFGPEPYLECGGQCNWELPGAFGLHGVNGDPERLAENNPGSSGCIRHSDKDISYIYNLLDVNEGIRYYINDV
jgi:hypothetical protein